MNFSVQSEVGQLRQAIVHRPGVELSRLTPQNIGELLFDDVLWAKKAKEEHDVFAETLRDQGVRVHYFGQLLAGTLEQPRGRAYVLDRVCTPEILGPTLVSPLRELFEDLDGPRLAEYLVGGVLKADLLDLRRGLGQPNGQGRPAAGDPAPPGRVPLPPHVRRGRLRHVLRRRRRQPPAGQRGRRRCARPGPRHGPDRHG
jgi:Arginine deiminase